MDDLISRQVAIDALRYAQHRFTVADEAGGMGTVKWSEDVIYFAAAENVLANLPSAQLERKKGEWKPFDLTWGRSVYRCTACGEAMDIPTEMSKPIYRFCPNCGADMGGEDNG